MPMEGAGAGGVGRGNQTDPGGRGCRRGGYGVALRIILCCWRGCEADNDSLPTKKNMPRLVAEGGNWDKGLMAVQVEWQMAARDGGRADGGVGRGGGGSAKAGGTAELTGRGSPGSFMGAMWHRGRLHEMDEDRFPETNYERLLAIAKL